MISEDSLLVEWCVDGSKHVITGPVNDHIMEVFGKGAFYEIDLLSTIADRYGTGGVYVDLGAFIGTHSLFFSIVCQADWVIAVEPSPLSFEYLQQNLQLNTVRNIEAFNIAVGSTQGRSKPTIGIDAGGTSWVDSQDVDGTVARFMASSVITTPAKLIKVDCELGTEDVVRGLIPAIEDHRPILAIETGYDGDWVSPILAPYSYKLVGTYCATPTGLWEPQ